jgi:hypothetical protein
MRCREAAYPEDAPRFELMPRSVANAKSERRVTRAMPREILLERFIPLAQIHEELIAFQIRIHVFRGIEEHPILTLLAEDHVDGGVIEHRGTTLDERISICPWAIPMSR